MPTRAVTIAVVLLLAAPAPADDYFWNPGTTSGNWAFNPNWSTPTNVPPYTTNWSSGSIGNRNTAHFTAAGQTINVNDFIPIAGINFTADGISVVSGGGTSDLRLEGSVPVSVAGTNTATITEDVVSIGAGVSLVKQGTGTLVLSGANTLTTVNVAAGTLRLGSSSAIGSTASSPALVVDGTLDLAGFSANRGVLSGSGTITNSASATTSTLTVGTGAIGTTTFSGVIQNGGGTVALTKVGTGTLILSGANTYTGVTSINEGTLRLDSAGALGTVGTISFVGGTLQFTSSNTTDYSSRFSNAAGQQYRLDTNSQSVTLASNLTSVGGSLNKINAGTLTLSGANEFTGGVTITNGRLVLNNANALGNSGAITFAGGTLVFSTNNAVDYSSRFTNTGSQPYSFDTSGQTVTLASDLAGAGMGLLKGGTGTLILSGTNTYAGTSTIFNGTLQIGNGGATGSITGDVANSATLAFNRSSDLTYAGVVSGTGSLTKLGAGTLTLSGTNTYTGPTTVGGGVLSISTLADGAVNSNIGAATSAAANLVLNGGTLRYTGGTVTTNRLFTLTQNGGTLDAGGSGSLQFNGPGAVAFTGSGARTLTLTGGTAGVLIPNLGDGTGGATGVTKTGVGIWGLSGTNTFTGPVAVQQGILWLVNTGVGGTNAAYTVSSGALLQVGTGFGGNVLSLGSLAGGGVVRPNDSGSFGTESVVIGGANTSTAFAGQLTNGGAGTTILAVTKTGGGTLTLTGTNSYTGATAIDGGTLAVNGSLAAGSLVSVNSGGTLRGTGNVNGQVSVFSGGTVAPGNGMGTLTVGNTFWLGGGGFEFEYNGGTTTPVAGTDNDLLKGRSGTFLNLAGLSTANRFNLDISATVGGASGSVAYRFAEFDTITGATPGDVSNLFNVTGDFYGTPSVTLTDGASLDYLTVTYTPIPEPGAVLLLCFAGLGVTRTVRRSRGAKAADTR